MARRTNADLLAEYRGRYSNSRMWVRDEYAPVWMRMINLYRGKQYRSVAPFDRMLVNIAFATINTLYPSVSIGRPKIVVSPRGPEDADQSVIAEAIVNYWWQHYECQEEFQLAVRDFLILGHGWVKSGYRYVEEGATVEESDDDLADGDKPTNFAETDIIVTEDRPFIERIDPFNMFVDPEGTTMKDIRWIAQRIRRPLKAVQADKRYDYKARMQVTASAFARRYDNINMDTTQYVGVDTTQEAYADIIEWYDLDKKTISVFSADGGDMFLVKPREIPFAFGHPFTMLRNYDIPGMFYPMGELEAIEPLQYELNETRTQMMNHRKRYSRKYLFKENAFDDFGRAALSSDEDNAMVPVKGDENISNVVFPMPALINPPDFYNQSSLIIGDIDRVSGISDYQRGVLPEVRRTATEASILQGAADSRAAEKLTIIELGIAKVAYRLIKLAQQFMTEEQTVRVLDKPGKWAWVNFDKDYIDGEFDFTVEAGSTVPMNEGFRRQRALQIVDAMAPFAQAGVIKLDKMAELVLEQGFGIKDPSKYMNQPEDEAPQGAPPQNPSQSSVPAGGMPIPAELPAGGPMPTPDQVAMGAPDTAGLPPEIAAMMNAGGAPPEPEMAPQGAPPAGLPPELAGLPPELLQELIATGQLPPEIMAALGGEQGMAPAPPMQLPPELAQIPGSELIPPEILMQLPPEILDEIVSRGGFTPEVIQILVESGILPAPPM